MSRFTPRFAVRSAVAGAALAALAATVVVPAANAVEYTGPVRMITTPEQAATEQYAQKVATDILVGNASLGNPVPTASSNVSLSDPDVANLVEAHKAKAYGLTGINRDADGILYAKVSHESGLVIVNPTNKWIQHYNEYTGGTYVLPPTSGHFEWVPKGGIGAKWKLLGAAAGYGLPTGPESEGLVAGVHVGATPYVTQNYNWQGHSRDIQWSQAHGSHAVKGSIRTFYLNNGGARTQGVATTDEYKYNGVVYQDFERIRIKYSNYKATAIGLNQR